MNLDRAKVLCSESWLATSSGYVADISAIFSTVLEVGTQQGVPTALEYVCATSCTYIHTSQV